MSGFTQDPKTLGAKELSIEDRFHFSCNACGNCCRGRTNQIKGTEIFLSGPDLWRISNLMKLSIEELIEKYVSVYFDQDLKLNVCSLKFKYSGSCYFLKNGHCSIYDARPRTCSLYPLGRAILINQIGKKFHFVGNQYTISEREPGYHCDYLSGESYTVYEWLEKNNVPLEDIDDIKWFEEMAFYSNKGNNKTLTENQLEDIFHILYDKPLK